MLPRKSSDNMRLAVSVLVLLSGVTISIFQFAKFLKAPLPDQLGYMCDDTFYYLEVCLNRVHMGMWSFDGINVTTGFHLLHAFILVLVIKLFGSSGENLMISAVMIAFLSYCGSSVMIFLISKRVLDKTYAFLFCGIWTGSFYNIRGYLTGMEFGLVLLLTTSFFFVLITLLDESPPENDTKRIALKGLFLFLISFLLCLARTDLALLGGVFSLMLLLCGFLLRAKNPSRALLLRMMGLITSAGTVISVITISAFCWTVTGKLIQDSGRIKRVWANIDATQNMNSPYEVGRLVKSFIGVSGNILRHTILVINQPFLMILLAGLICLLLVIILSRFRTLIASPKFGTLTILSLSACCHILVTTAYYSVSLPGMQPRWYYAKIFCSMLFVLLYIIFCFREVGYRLKLFGNRASLDANWLVFPIFIIIILTNIIRTVSFEGAWKYQKEMYAAAKMLENLPEDARIGSWNAGILGYFSERTVVNLDGLVNSSIEDYVRRCRLDEYIEDNHIAYIADYNIMLSEGTQAQILPQSWSSTHLVRLYSIPPSEESWWWGGYSIWEVVDNMPPSM